MDSGSIGQLFEGVFGPIAAFLSFLFLGGKMTAFGDFVIKPFGFPPLVLWLFLGGLYFTFRLGFVNLRLFGHGIACVLGRYSSKDDPGSVTHFQALSTAVSATVGLGNIGGVAIAVTLGGPGAVVWMMIAAFFGMSAKFAEVTLGQKYRRISEDGEAYGGAFYYLKDGLAEIGWPRMGKILAGMFGIFCIGGAIGGGILFQANQSVSLMTDTFSVLHGQKVLVSLVFAGVAMVVLLGGIKRIAVFAETVVPVMAIIYISAVLVVLAVNHDQIIHAVSIMFGQAFTGSALGGGLIGTMMQGVRRAAFSNEAGLGSAPIAHATAKTKEPVREGCVALLEPFIDTIIICFLTGLMVTVTGTYVGADLDLGGALITSRSFATVIDWFPIILSVAATMFAFSTVITYSYYGEQAWFYLFGHKRVRLCQSAFVFFIFVGGVISLGTVVSLADILFLLMAVPNLLGMVMLSGVLRREVASYVNKLKSGQFESDEDRPGSAGPIDPDAILPLRNQKVPVLKK